MAFVDLCTHSYLGNSPRLAPFLLPGNANDLFWAGSYYLVAFVFSFIELFEKSRKSGSFFLSFFWMLDL